MVDTGYEVTSVDVVEACDRATDAASRLNKIDQIQQFVESDIQVKYAVLA